MVEVKDPNFQSVSPGIDSVSSIYELKKYASLGNGVLSSYRLCNLEKFSDFLSLIACYRYPESKLKVPGWKVSPRQCVCVPKP